MYARRIVHQTPTARWELAVRPPGARVGGLLRGDLCGYRETTEGPARRTEVPSLAVPLIFDFGELRIVEPGQHTHHRGGFVAGLGDRPAITEHSGQSRGLQVNLSLLAARRILGVPMDELTNRVVPLDALFRRSHPDLCDRLREAPDWDARFDLVEAFLTERVGALPEVPPPVAWALARIVRSRGAIDIGALARQTGFSQKHLAAQFRNHVGLPPKRVARLVRFDAVVAHLKAGGQEDWAALAHRFGYFDQSHLNREFRAFTDGTPTAVRSAVAEVGDLFG